MLALSIPSLPFSAFFVGFPLILLFLILLTSRRWRRNYHHRGNLPPSPPAIPIVGHLHLIGPLIHQSFQSLSQRYGPLFSLRLGSVPCIVVSSSDMAREFLKVNEVFFMARQDTIARNRLTYNSSYSVSPDVPYWRFAKRLIMTHVLSPTALNQFLTIRNNNLLGFLNVLTESSIQGSKINVTQEVMKLISSIVCQIMLGLKDHDIKGQMNEACRGLIRELTEIIGQFNVSDFIWFCKGLDLQGFNKKVKDIGRRYDSLLESILASREDIRKKKDDMNGDGDTDQAFKCFLDLLLDVMEDETSEIKITRDNIKGLILDFLTAATDTSSISIDWCLAELINNPLVLQKAQEEIDSVIGKGRLVHETDVKNLPYLQAIIKETFRLHPPLALSRRRSVRDCEICGYHIPNNSFLFVNIWAVGRDPEYWKNPLDYWPERFLKPNNDGENSFGLSELKGQNFQLFPFGIGKKGCPGANLALQVVPTVVASLIQCFEWKFNSSSTKGEIDMREKPGLTIPRASDLVCTLMLRVNSSLIFNSPHSQQE